MTTKVKLTRARMSFNDLWVAVEYEKGDGKPRFNLTLLITPDSANDKALKAAINAEAQATWGKGWEKKLEQIKTNPQKNAYYSGDLKDYDGWPGNMALAAHSKTRPLVIDAVGVTSDADKEDGREYTEKNAAGLMFPILTAQDGKPYSGCYVNVTVEIYAQGDPNWGMRCGFKGVQFAKDGDAFGGGAPANPDDFGNEDLSTENEEEESLAG